MNAVMLALALGCPPDTGWTDIAVKPPKAIVVPMMVQPAPPPRVVPLEGRTYPWDREPYPRIFKRPMGTRQILG